MVKSKKRAFLRRKKKSLTEELMQDTKSVWRCLDVPAAKPSLDPESWLAFAEQLYFFPEASSMPKCKVVLGLFCEEEVKILLRSLANGKSEDGLSVELLKWGGECIVPFLIKALEDDFIYTSPQT